MLDMLSSTNNKVGYIWVADVGHFSQAPKAVRQGQLGYAIITGEKPQQ